MRSERAEPPANELAADFRTSVVCARGRILREVRGVPGDPGTYARALERLYEVNLLPAGTRIQRPTHPHLYDRLLAAGVTPDYARPALPSRWRARLALLFSLAATLSCVLLWIAFLRGIAPP